MNNYLLLMVLFVSLTILTVGAVVAVWTFNRNKKPRINREINLKSQTQNQLLHTNDDRPPRYCHLFGKSFEVFA